MSDDVVPCDELREPFYRPGRCICGVLSQLHTAEGWASFYGQQANACTRSAASHRARADDLDRAATEARSRAATFPTPRKFDRPIAAATGVSSEDTER